MNTDKIEMLKNFHKNDYNYCLNLLNSRFNNCKTLSSIDFDRDFYTQLLENLVNSQKSSTNEYYVEQLLSLYFNSLCDEFEDLRFKISDNIKEAEDLNFSISSIMHLTGIYKSLKSFINWANEMRKIEKFKEFQDVFKSIPNTQFYEIEKEYNILLKFLKIALIKIS